jgi:hypothetical protein
MNIPKAIFTQIDAGYDSAGRLRTLVGLDDRGRIWKVVAGPDGALGDWEALHGPEIDALAKASTTVLAERYLRTERQEIRDRIREILKKRGKSEFLDAVIDEATKPSFFPGVSL